MITETVNSKQHLTENSARDNRNDSALILLALFWPVAGAIAAFFMLHRRVARFVLGAVMVMFGYRLAPVDQRLDAYRLGEYVKNLAGLNFTEFSSWVNQYCFHSEECIDPIQPFYTFLLTRLSGEPQVAFAGYALLFAILSIATLAALRRDKSPKSDAFFYFFLFVIMASNAVHNIGGFRFNTASWAFLLGSYLVFYRGRDLGFLFILLAAIFHYAMFLFVALALVLRFFRFTLRYALILALASFAVSGSDQLIAPLLSLDYQMGALFRASRYISDAALEAQSDALQQASSGSNLMFSVYENTGIKIVLAAWMAYLLIFKRKFSNVGLRETTYLSYAITLFAIANVFGDLPSFGRYSSIALQLLYIGFIVSATMYSKREKNILIAVFVPAFLFSMLIKLRIGLGLMDMYSMLPSPFLIFQRTPIL